MILVMDVGNSNISMGIYVQDELTHHWRMATDRHKTEDEYGMQIKNFLSDVDFKFTDVTGMIMSSVVPPIMFSLERMASKYFKLKPLIVGPGLKTGLNIKYDNPKEVGADRIVNAVAAIHEYGSPLTIADFGTATTYCYINEAHQYMGGDIAPGIGISTEALYSRAAKMPRIEIARPENIIGKNTVSAMQAGIVYGFVGQAEGIITRMKLQSREVPTVIATGGMASLIAAESKLIDKVDPFLTLKGLYLIYKRNEA